MKNNERLTLSNQVVQWEHEGMQLSEPWYTFGSVDIRDAERLLDIQEKSLQALHCLAGDLDTWLRDVNPDPARPREAAQYAFELTQELIASQSASQALLQNIKNATAGEHPEFARAVALKEKAAAEQAIQLRDAVKKLQ